MKIECILCGNKFNEIDFIYSLSQSGYCSQKCKETDEMITKADHEEK